MIRRYAAAALAASTLFAAWPAQAAAKGVPTSVRLCGPAACVRISDRAVRLALAGTEADAGGPAPSLAPYLRLTVRPHMFGPAGYLVPSQGVVVLGSGAYRLDPPVLDLVRSRLATIAPYRPRIGRVWVGGGPVSGPSAYAALLRRPSVTPPESVWAHGSLPVGIVVEGSTPWAAWGSARYFPAMRLLHVPDGAWVRVTASQAAMIAAAVHPSRPAGGPDHVAVPIAIALGGVCAALAAGAARHRPRWRPRGA
jgi:hypothetical protein